MVKYNLFVAREFWIQPWKILFSDPDLHSLSVSSMSKMPLTHKTQLCFALNIKLNDRSTKRDSGNYFLFYGDCRLLPAFYRQYIADILCLRCASKIRAISHYPLPLCPVCLLLKCVLVKMLFGASNGLICFLLAGEESWALSIDHAQLDGYLRLKQ